MPAKRFARITGPEDTNPGNQWCYKCDTEAEVVSTIDDEAVIVYEDPV